MEALRKFEGSSLDELLEHVYRECGPQARIVEANKIRRGGVGGFFAKEAFEVVVEPEPGHVPPAAGERPAPPPPPPPAPPDEPATRGRRLDVLDTADEDDELVADLVSLSSRSTQEPVRAQAVVDRSAGERARPVSFDDVLEDAMAAPPDEELTMSSRTTDTDLHALLAARATTPPTPPAPPAPEPADETDDDQPVMVEPVDISEATARPKPAPARAPAAGPAVVPASEEQPGSQALALAAHYSSVPAAPPVPTGPGAVAVVGYRTEALAVAEHLAAGTDARVLLATNRPVPGDIVAMPLRTVEEALDACRPKGKTGRRVRTTEHLIVAVDLGDGPSGLLFAQQLLQAIKAEQVRLAVNVEEHRDDTDATIQLLGAVDAVDVVLPGEGVAGIDPAPLLSLSAPVATIDGLPATPGLWAALSIEMEHVHG